MVERNSTVRSATPDPKLMELRPEFRDVIASLLDELRSKGFEPRISNAFRTHEQQVQKVAQGYAMPGATHPGPHNWGLACDIIDRRWGWTPCDQSAAFFAALADGAMARGLTCGGTWFGPNGTREKPTRESVWNRFGLGWDVAHIELPKPPKALRQEYRGVKGAA